jgi:hypothetical protein
MIEFSAPTGLWVSAPRNVADGDLDRSLDDGSVVCTHVLRSTWHLVSRDDVQSLLALTGPRVQKADGGRYCQLELDARTLFRCEELIAVKKHVGSSRKPIWSPPRRGDGSAGVIWVRPSWKTRPVGSIVVGLGAEAAQRDRTVDVNPDEPYSQATPQCLGRRTQARHAGFGNPRHRIEDGPPHDLEDAGPPTP